MFFSHYGDQAMGNYRHSYGDWAVVQALWVLVACIVSDLLGYSRCQAQPATPSTVSIATENLQRVGLVHTDGGQTLGTCFYCDERGYVATCLSNLLEHKEAFVRFDATRLRVAGFVAASSGMDIAILQLADIPKGDLRFKRSLELHPHYAPELEEPLLPWSRSHTIPDSVDKLPKLLRVLRGDEYCSGLRRLPSTPLGCRADTCWMWLSQTGSLSMQGAPVFNQTGKVVGMMSLGPNRQPNVFSALHIQHVANLIPKDNPKPKSLKLLKGLVDPLPTIAELTQRVSLADEFENQMAGELEFGLPLAQRYAELLKHSERAVTEKAAIEQSMSIRQENNLELLAKINKLQGDVNAIVPEEPYTVEVKESKSERDQSKTNGDRRTRREVRMRFSPAQVQTATSLRTQIENERKKLTENNQRLEFDVKIRLPFVNEIIDHQEDDAFFRADPLGMRPRSEHVEFESALTALIDEGEAHASIYFARGMTRIHLQQFKDAMVDLQEANEIDTKYRPLCRALNARIAGLEGGTNKADASIKGLLREHKEDAKLQTLMARIELDGKTPGGAVRHIQGAHELLPHEVDLQVALAWLLSQNNVNSKLALESATSAVTLTGYRDWDSLAALANVHMMLRKNAAAIDTIRLATQLATPSAKAQCEQWQGEIEGENLIKRSWK